MDEIIRVEIIIEKKKRILGTTYNTGYRKKNDSAEETETNEQTSRRIQKAGESCKPREQIILIKRS